MAADDLTGDSLDDIIVGSPNLPRGSSYNAGAVYLFCIPESDYISGEVVLVAGGFVI